MLTAIGQECLAGTAPLFPLSVIGMMLTSSGIYGVLAFAVSRRTRELAASPLEPNPGIRFVC